VFYKNEFKPKTPILMALLGFTWVGIILKNTGTLPGAFITVALTWV
jgi:hypothetical protein